MRIKTKLLASHAIMSALVILIAASIIGILRIGEANQRELQSSYEQIRAINAIAALANDYAEQVAELYILGTDPTEIEEARMGLFTALDRKETLVREELAYVTDAQEVAREEGEVARVIAMRETVTELELARKLAAEKLSDGRRDEAERLYRDQIEHRLDSVLGLLIEAATENEREEVIEAIEASADLSDRLRSLAFGLVAASGLLVLANAIMVHRAVSRPIAHLAEGAEAIGRGDLSHRVPVQRRDELGSLATRFNDMTAQIATQRDRLLKAKGELEKQVAERTQELRSRGEDLERAVKRLEKLDADRAQFFADISHELRTPLTIMRGTAEVTLRSPDTPAQRLREALAQVVRKADQMGRLVEDLLFLARSEAGAIKIDRKPVDLQDVVADVLLDSQGLSRRTGVTLSPRQVSQPIVVEGDADRLRQAILIPLDNAMRLAPDGSSVRLELAARDGHATVTVSDDGPGFTPDEARHAFNRFFRGEPARGRTARSTGLGLSIARWIVDQHGGSIDIDSKRDKGATIRIDLPLAPRGTA